MSYIKTNYVNGVTPLNASNLNKNETQTEKNSNDIVTLSQVMVQLDDNLLKKVDKVEGKTLTTNDFSNTYKTKLDGLSNYTHPNDSNTRHVSDAEKNTWNSKANGNHSHADLLNLINELKARVDLLENPPKPKPPTFCGQMPFKEVSDITYEDLKGLVNIVEVTKPQTIYAHSGATMYNKTVICAVPKDDFNITGVVDGANVNIMPSYPITEKTLNVDGIGSVTYVISCNKVAQAYNATTQVKFNLI